MKHLKGRKFIVAETIDNDGNPVIGVWRQSHLVGNQ
jgi:hypothetical protein